MPKLNLFKLLPLGVWIAIGIFACNKTNQQQTSRQLSAADSIRMGKLIADANRLEDIDNDSLLTIAKELYEINKRSGDHKALVYAQVIEASYLWQSSYHERAMALAIKSLSNAQKFGINKPLPKIYALIGNLHKETSNYAMAFQAAGQGLAAAINNKDTASIIALMGLKAMFIRGLSLNHHQPKLKDKSLPLNLEALKIAESSPKYETLRTRFYDNLCSYYKDMNNLDSAFYYGNKGVAMAIKNHQNRSLTYSYAGLGEAYCLQGNQARGIAYLNKAMQIARELNEPYRVMEIYESFYDCYDLSGDYKDALHYYHIASKMRDSLKVLNNVKQISELQIRYETVQKDKKIMRLKDEEKIETIKYDAVFVILFLLVIIGILMYIKEKRRKDLILSEKCLVDIELKNATLELQYFTDNLTQKNELIEEFKAKIEQLHFQNVNRADIEGLDILVKENIMTDEKWDNFRRLFTKVHGTFFTSLKQKFPNITSTDVRMLSLIKLQLGNYEMANMLGVTIEGIKKSKQRLRKKMDLQKDESIEDVIDAL